MFCPFCGTPNNDDAAQCVKCGHNFQATAINPLPPSDEPDESMLAPAAASPAQSYPQAQTYPMETAPVSQPTPNPQATWQEQPNFGQSSVPQQWAQPSYPQQAYGQQAYGQMPPGQGNDSFSALIPYKNSSALIAYYLAVFSLIPCFGLILGSAAFVLGLKGLKFAKQHPEAKGTAHAWVGIILGGLCGLVNITLLLLGIIGALSSQR